MRYMNTTVYFAVIDAESSVDITESSDIIMMMTLFYFILFHELPSVIHNVMVYFAAIDAESSAVNLIKLSQDRGFLRYVLGISFGYY